MSWTSGISSVLDSGAIDAAIEVGTQPSLWDGVTDFATNAFGWMKDNPEITNILGGVALGGAQAYLQGSQAEDQRAHERDMYDRKVMDARQDREDRMAKPGELRNYDSHRNTIAGRGMITNGLLTGEEV